jgi:penicillin-binding protein 1C
MLNLIGYQNFYQFLQKINLINYPWRDADYYGLGLVIGNPEVTLEQLVCAYAMLANGGKYQKCSYILGEKQLPPRSIISPQTAYIITDILKDASARMLGFGNTSIFSLPVPVALKTGTSTHYRDCWIIGYTPEYTLGVWVGNFEGNPTYQLSGAEAAGPIFRDIINFLYRWSYPGEFPLPEDIITLGICPYSGCLPNVYCPYISRELFWKGSEPQKKCSFHTTSLPRHRLTPAYAAWLYQKKCQGTLGQYRLQGFGEDLESVFDNPWKKIEGREEASLEIENSPKYFSNRIRIIYPFNNDRFLLGRNAKNGIIKLWAISEKPVKYITWYINGREYAKTQPPYQIYWRLKKGKHSIIAFDPNNIGDEVIIRVE